MIQSIVSYLKANLGIGTPNDFVKEYRRLDADAKADLAQYARDEASALGIELAEKAAS